MKLRPVCALTFFTKAFSNAVAWRHACDLNQIVDPSALSTLVISPDLALEPPPPVLPERGGGGTQR